MRRRRALEPLAAVVVRLAALALAAAALLSVAALVDRYERVRAGPYVIYVRP